MTQELSRFHEFMPDKVWKWKILEEKMERILSLHDYQEIRLSVLQDYQVLHTGITALMQGSEADHAVQSVLSITSPDNNLSLLSLRPEGTISVLHHTARIINTGEVHRFYYSGPMFRKAEALKQMEFYQLGVELLGSESILSENEVISLGMKICHDLGLKEVRLDMNSYGCMQCRDAFFADLRKFLEDNKDKFCSDCYRELFARVTSCSVAPLRTCVRRACAEARLASAWATCSGRPPRSRAARRALAMLRFASDWVTCSARGPALMPSNLACAAFSAACAWRSCSAVAPAASRS